MTTNEKDQLSILKRRRAVIKTQITKFKNYLSTTENSPDADIIQIKVEALSEHFKNLNIIHEELIELDAISAVAHDAEYDYMEEEYHLILGKARKLIRKAQQTESDITFKGNPRNSYYLTPEAVGLTPSIKLPDITLPKFDGTLEKWHSFKDKFEARIGNNRKIPDVDKFQYLQSSLSGKAARAIESMEGTAENYHEAWDILTTKYSNARKTILRHWDILEKLPGLTKDTPVALDDLVATFRQHLRSLKSLDQPIENWDCCIIYLLLSKVSENTRYHWELSLTDNKMPSYTHLLDFLEKRGNCTEQFAQMREIDNKPKKEYSRPFQTTRNHNQGRAFMATPNHNFRNSSSSCPVCRSSHSIYKCKTFRGMSINKRKQIANRASLCHNCLGMNHTVNECKAGNCRVCNDKHHTLLHVIGSISKESTTSNPTNYLKEEQTSSPLSSENINAINLYTPLDDIVPTAMIYIHHRDHTPVLCRAIIDTGSSRNFITNELATLLQLPRTEEQNHIGGLNESSTVSQFSVKTTIESRNNNYKRTLDFLSVPTITSFTPTQQINRKTINIPKNLQLADPDFHVPAPVQILLGAGTTLSALCVGQITLSSCPELVAQKTQWGWIIGGNLPLYQKSDNNVKCHLAKFHEDISRFWELEDCISVRHLSQEETRCEKHFKENTKRDNDGRYVVALPFNDKKKEIGESYMMSLKRLQSLERRFKRVPELELQYKNVINEYIKLGYMLNVTEKICNSFYLPHQAIIKESSLTTKVRVVFDASAASSTGVSLNAALLAGPTIQSDIFSLLLRFRLHNHVLTGDIEKMYLQLKVQEDDQPYLRILWRDPDGSISTFQFNRLIFGLKPASYLAIRTIHQLADEEQSQYPRAARIIKRDLYVDDLLTGADTIDEVIQLQKEITKLLKSGGFNLRQCASNNAQILHSIPERNVNLQLQSNTDTTLKTLGVHWNSNQDAIIYTVKNIKPNRVTKRTIFAEIAKIFDPLGLLNPVIVTSKLIMQDLWKLKVEWDESLPLALHTKWEEFASQLIHLNDITFHRKMLINQYSRVELHGFCDASEKAYGSCFYIYSIDNAGHAQVQLYCAKSRVAPIKTPQTIPRLELCAATLLADLYEIIQSGTNIRFHRVVFWTDSMIALHWINTSPHLLKTFVANRVSVIASKTNKSSWRHIHTYDNPADLLSRGVMPNEFKNKALWFNGPKWLAGGEECWPEQKIVKCNDLPDVKRITCLVTNTINIDIFTRYSSYTKLQRIIARCLRWLKSRRKKGPLLTCELRYASNRILQLVQRKEFPAEYKTLMNKQHVHPKSKLLALNPFIGNDGLIRVGGRLDSSCYSYQKKHPVLLPKSDHITHLLINEEHLNTLHGGVQLTLCSLRQKYWPIDGRNQVRKVLRKCVRCMRAKPIPVNYVMGNLPAVRTTQTRPFLNSGVDYCGPFLIKEKRFRNRNKIKIYVAVFICFVTKAVHLETVSDLTTEGFLAALKRFISRRGKCVSIYSDNGTHFVGANNTLKELQDILTSKEHNEKVHDYLAVKNIEWHFSPPQAPHFGGIWEAAVKSFKHHLRRVIGPELFTFEQFNTLVIEIEAILNSRPLIPLSSDPNDFSPLTPAHFLIGDQLSSLPEQDFSGTPENRLSTLQHIQKVKQDFWNRWHIEYVNELNIRHKWTRGSHPIKENSIVVIREDNLPSLPLQWRIGRVIETYPGPDGIIRTVRLRTSNGEITRSVKKLAPLLDDKD